MTNTWQPIETVPQDKAVALWIKSKYQAEYGRRATHIGVIGDTYFGTQLYFGEGVPDSNYGEYASHWMPLPEPPKD